MGCTYLSKWPICELTKARVKIETHECEDKIESLDAIEAETYKIQLMDKPHQLPYSITAILDLKETKVACDKNVTAATQS
jgi:hypothetical protein